MYMYHNTISCVSTVMYIIHRNKHVRIPPALKDVQILFVWVKITSLWRQCHLRMSWLSGTSASTFKYDIETQVSVVTYPQWERRQSTWCDSWCEGTDTWSASTSYPFLRYDDTIACLSNWRTLKLWQSTPWNIFDDVQELFYVYTSRAQSVIATEYDSVSFNGEIRVNTICHALYVYLSGSYTCNHM